MIRSLSTHSFLSSTIIFPLGSTLLPSKVCKVYSFLHLGNWVRARIPVSTRAVSALMSSKSGMEQVLVENEVQQVRLLDSVNDDHGGVIVELSESMDSKVFASMLKASLALWRSQGKRGVWIKVPIELVNLVEAAVKEGFWFHHAEPKYLMLAFWIPEGAHTLPANASHRVGVGAFVMNKKREVLVVQEKSGLFRGTGVWKFPTGVVDEGEDICAAAMREVKEETAIDTEFVEVLAFRYAVYENISYHQCILSI
ncbi:hypothetical protein H0E87_013705 [Populus deltoides]|uniref:Nudix hydrolase domain-containing protein n=1 Tax=Populus deltoides TaxID=3696 RepID=A0A8T2YPG5_POPDE|nr:hypothetical protein H0E87_013705 [Populus deltoides]